METYWYIGVGAFALLIWAVLFFRLFGTNETRNENRKALKLILFGPWYWVLKDREGKGYIFTKREWIGWGIVLGAIAVALVYF